MKRILTFICMLALFLGSVSCSSGLEAQEMTVTGSSADTQKETPSTTEEEMETGPIVYPDGFSVGYSRVDITPDEVFVIYNGKGNYGYEQSYSLNQGSITLYIPAFSGAYYEIK